MLDTFQVLGVDQSYTGFGYATSDGTFGKGFPANKYEHNTHRLAEIRTWYNVLVRNYPLDLMVMEGYAAASKFGRELSGELGGIIKVTTFDAGVPILVVPPTVLKKFVTGRGNAKKNEMLLGVYKRWGEEFHDDNKADAYALRKFGLAYSDRADWPLTAAQVELIAKFRKERQPEEPVS